MENPTHHEMVSHAARAITCAAVWRMRNTGTSACDSTAAATEPKSNRRRPLRPCVVIAIRSASTSRAPARISATGSPRRTAVVTRTPWARSWAAIDARYSSAPARSFATSSMTSCRAPSTAIGGAGTRTRTRATSMSSGPAISRMNGMIDSATIEPSSGTSARLYMGSPPCGRSPDRKIHRGALGANDENRSRRPPQYRLGDAAQDQATETGPAVGGHHDQVGLLDVRRLDDRGGGRAVPHVGFDAPESTVLEAPDDRREVLLSLANRQDLGLDRVSAGQRVGLGGPEQAERCAVLLGEIERSPHPRFGQHRSVKRNENLVELHMSSPVAVSLLQRPPLLEQRGCQQRTQMKTTCSQGSLEPRWGREASVGHRRPAGDGRVSAANLVLVDQPVEGLPVDPGGLCRGGHVASVALEQITQVRGLEHLHPPLFRVL